MRSHAWRKRAWNRTYLVTVDVLEDAADLVVAVQLVLLVEGLGHAHLRQFLYYVKPRQHGAWSMEQGSHRILHRGAGLPPSTPVRRTIIVVADSDRGHRP